MHQYSHKLKVPNGLMIINAHSARVYHFILNCPGRGRGEKQTNYLVKCYVALAAAAATATWQTFTKNNAITSAQHTVQTSVYVRTARDNNRYTEEEEEGEMKKEKNKNGNNSSHRRGNKMCSICAKVSEQVSEWTNERVEKEKRKN